MVPLGERTRANKWASYTRAAWLVCLQAEELTLGQAIVEGQTSVHEALCDNLSTHTAMEALFAIVKAVNVYLAAKTAAAAAVSSGAAAASSSGADGDSAAVPGRVQPLLLRKAGAYVTRMLAVFGLVPSPADSPGLGGAGDGSSAASTSAGARCARPPASPPASPLVHRIASCSQLRAACILSMQPRRALDLNMTHRQPPHHAGSHGLAWTALPVADLLTSPCPAGSGPADQPLPCRYRTC
jgi:hypothetical protein